MGTTAQKLQAIVNSKAAIGDAIVSKGGTVPQTLSAYGTAIRKLPCSLDALPLEDDNASWCIFVDCEGRVVAYFNKTQTLALTELPPVPAPPFDGLVNGIWNWTLEEVKAATLPMCIGPLYDTNDGKSWIKITIPENNFEWRVYTAKNSSTYGRLDWGDGSSEETLTSGYHTHTYASAGNYVVKVYSTRGTQSDIYLADNMKGICGSFNTPSDPKFRENMACITDVAIMYNYFPPHSLNDACNCVHAVFRTATDTGNVGFGQGMTKLRQISIRRGGKGISGGGAPYPTDRAWDLQCICYTPTTTASGEHHTANHANSVRIIRYPFSDRTGNIGQNAYDGNRNLRFFRVPGDQTLGSGSVFDGDCNLKRIVFKENGTAPTTIANSVFNGCYNLEIIENLSLSSVTTLGSNAFNECRKLWRGQTVSFPELTSIAQNALRYTSAREYVIGKAGTTLTVSSTGAFSECRFLRRIKINGDVSKVMGSFCSNDYQLEVVDFSGCTTVPALDNVNAFANTPSLQKIIVPDSLYTTWIAASNWSSTTNNIVNRIVKASEA